MRWTSAIGLAGLALAGCGQNDEGSNLSAASEQEVPSQPAVTDTEQQAGNGAETDSEIQSENGGNPQAAGTLPPADGQLRFVGRWASSAANCRSLAWKFTERKLETPAGSVCTFERLTPVGGGYDIRAVCTAEGPPQDDVLRIRFAESAKAMLFESNAIADAGLVYCGSAA